MSKEKQKEITKVKIVITVSGKDIKKEFDSIDELLEFINDDLDINCGLAPWEYGT